MGNWSKLKADEKIRVIKFARQNGVSDINTIRDTYNLYSSGGQEEILNKVNSSNANFVQRLKDPNRKNIPDWESPIDRISTHKLSVGTDENGNHYIFPEVQEINEELIDFTRPPYNRFAGEISAEMRGDTVRVSSIEDAIKFTETYKQYYPGYNKKSTGGPLYPFSFEKNPFLKTPVVRYDEGGHLFGFGDWLLNLFNTNKSQQQKQQVEDQTWQSLPDTIITTPKTNLNADISSIANTVTPGINTDMLTTRGGFNTFNKFNIGDNDIYAVDKENKQFIPLDKKQYIDNMRPRLDYIGGNKDQTRKQAIEVFGLWPSIVDVANLYQLSPDLLARRLSKEGFLDTYTDRYNQYSNKEQQKTMQNNPQLFWDSEVNSYNDFGLDTVLQNYIDGNISILDQNVKEFYDDLIKNNKYTQGSNEKGDVTLNFNGSVLQLFHLQAAYFKYLESIYNARRKQGLYENIDLDTFLNAAYNLGIYNDDLQDAEWVNNNYKVPSWYTK